MGLVTVSEVRGYIGIQQEEYDDTTVQLMIDAITDYIHEITNNYWDTNGLKTETDEYYKGQDSSTLVLKHSPIGSVTALSIDDDGDYSYTSIDVANDIQVLNETGIIVLKDTATLTSFKGTSKNPYNVKVTYTWGSTTIPNNVKLLALDLIAEKISSDAERKARVERRLNELKRWQISSV